MASLGVIQLMCGEHPLDLNSIKITTTINGRISQTTMDILFFNPQYKSLEGELDFPLPENAVVVGYSYEFEGRLLPASIVEKEKARVTFEKEVRSGGATSLVEHVKGNSFKARIYPIPSHGTKQVQLTYTHDLPSSEEGHIQYRLPFALAADASLEIDIDVLKSDDKPRVTSNLSSVQVEQVGDGWHIRFASTSTKLENFALDLPYSDSDEILIGKKDFGHYDEMYFSIASLVKIPESTVVPSSCDSVAIAWDASFSFSKIDRSTELKLLEILLKNVKNVDLIIFRNVQDPVKNFQNFQIAEILEYLKKVDYDGGTDLENLTFSGNYQKIFLFTDGFSTLSADIPKKVPSAPVYAFINSDVNNFKSLNQFSTSTGGSTFNLKIKKIEKVVEEMSSGGKLNFLSATFNPAEISEVYPNIPTAMDPDEPIRIAGKLVGEEAEISLNFGTDLANIQFSKNFKLKKSDSVGISDIIPRIWASKKLDHLTTEAGDEKDKLMLKLGRKYGIVTPNASLLVLTTLDQYIQHKIKPSKDALPQLYDEWSQRKVKLQDENNLKKKNKLDKVYQWWSSRKQWWSVQYDSKFEDLYLRNNPLPTIRAPPGSHTKILTEEEATAAAEKSFVPQLRESPQQPVSRSRKSDSPSAPLASASNSMCAPPPPPSAYESAPMLKSAAPMMDDMFAAPMSAAPQKEMKSKVMKKKMAKEESFEEEERCDDGDQAGNKDSILDENSEKTPGSASIGVQVQNWSPDVPYLNRIKAVPVDQQYAKYLEERSAFSDSPAFYLDCCCYFFAEKQKEIGLRIVTNIVELKIEDARLMRIVANQIYQEDMLDQALYLFKLILKLKNEEPQSHRELALVLAAKFEFQLAVNSFNHVLETEWPIRFQHIEDEVIWELNRTLWLAEKAGKSVDISKIDSRFLERLPCDVKVVITWDVDDLCIDLHIHEPSGDKCYYGRHVTSIGGWSTPDYSGCTAYSTAMLREYMVRDGFPGTYHICGNYYSSSRQDLTGGTTIWFTIYTNYMKENEQKQMSVLRLTQASVIPTYQSESQLAVMNYESGELIAKIEEKSKRIRREFEEREAEWKRWEAEEKEIVAGNQEMVKEARKKIENRKKAEKPETQVKIEKTSKVENSDETKPENSENPKIAENSENPKVAENSEPESPKKKGFFKKLFSK
eukprot:TRINITY_DN2904_c0_g1_i4.p1 TRINITY_DN2904_c0_g1~~TRINITY_DN2904_c0_g1_i4.p1  ORF type:complete len:1168 (-),score=440.41 TRINITY_DN2904_c0_g1_i4:11-3514(-)